MNAHVSSILLGVRDMDRSKEFYMEGLGWKVKHDYGISVFFEPNGGSARRLLRPRRPGHRQRREPGGQRLQRAGPHLRGPQRGAGRRDHGGGREGRRHDHQAAATQEWGGYGGSFADPDGYIWNIGYSAQGKDQPYAE